MANNTGVFFNINDNDGIPLVGVSTDGKVLINHLYGNCLIGSTSATGTASQPLQVNGGAYFNGPIGINTGSYDKANVDVKNPYANLILSGNVGSAQTSGWISFIHSGNSTGAIENYNGVLYLRSENGSNNGSIVFQTGGAAYKSKPSVSGTSRVVIDGSGNLGVGNTNPTSKLFVTQASSNQSTEESATHAIALSSGNNGRTMWMGYDDTIDAGYINAAKSGQSRPIYLQTRNLTNATTVFVGIGTTAGTGTANQYLQIGGGAYVSGNLGIGITNPTSLLHVLGSNNSTPVSISAGDAATFTFSGNSSSGYSANFNINDTGLTIGHNSASRDFRLQTNSSPRLTITAGGNVGIGTTNPARILDIYSASGSNTVKLTANGISAGFIADSVGVSNRGGYFSAQQGGVQRAVFGVSGAWEGNTTSDAAIGADTGGSIRFYTNGSTERARFDASGNLGVGITNPTSKLHVIGDTRVGIDTSQGVILTSPNGTKFRLFVSNAGVLSTVLVP